MACAVYFMNAVLILITHGGNTYTHAQAVSECSIGSDLFITGNELGKENVVFKSINITCEGDVVGWKYQLSSVSELSQDREPNIEATVWRHVRGRSYQLIGKSKLPIKKNKNGIVEYHLPYHSVFHVQPGDIVGIHYFDVHNDRISIKPMPKIGYWIPTNCLHKTKEYNILSYRKVKIDRNGNYKMVNQHTCFATAALQPMVRTVTAVATTVDTSISICQDAISYKHAVIGLSISTVILVLIVIILVVLQYRRMSIYSAACRGQEEIKSNLPDDTKIDTVHEADSAKSNDKRGMHGQPIQHIYERITSIKRGFSQHRNRRPPDVKLQGQGKNKDNLQVETGLDGGNCAYDYSYASNIQKITENKDDKSAEIPTSATSGAVCDEDDGNGCLTPNANRSPEVSNTFAEHVIPEVYETACPQQGTNNSEILINDFYSSD